MDQSNYKEALEQLRQSGFTPSEIEQLCRLRRDYPQLEFDRISIDLRRLEFVRWLVATGKLTDQRDAHQPFPATQQNHVERDTIDGVM
jgi:hypothetical protein